MHITRKAGLALALPLLSTAFLPSAHAQTPVIPISYTATPGEGQAQGGLYNYPDDTGKQLTDGITGVDNWQANLGNGPAYEWVGWKTVDPTMSFSFGQDVTISSVSIGFNRAEANAIYLPPTVTIDGDAFTLSPTAIANNTRGFLTFDGNWTGSTLSINLVDQNPSRWIFVDEIRFNSPVPEASTTVSLGLLLCLGLGGLAVNAQRRKAQTRV